MSTDQERRAEARRETIDDYYDRHGAICEDCGTRFATKGSGALMVTGYSVCPNCGGEPQETQEGDI